MSSTVTEIAASAQEQTSALEQVNTAVNAMHQVAQPNATKLGKRLVECASARLPSGSPETLS